MPLPNAEHAEVDIRKLRDYCLSQEHPRGKHKARVFASALGMTAKDAETLRTGLLHAVQTLEAVLDMVDVYGTRYVLDFTLQGPTGTAGIRSNWIIRTGDDIPRFVTCYVL